MKKYGREGKIAVVVGTVTDDIRMFDVPKMKVRFTHPLSCKSKHTSDVGTWFLKRRWGDFNLNLSITVC